MPCYHPITGYKSREINESGKRSIVFNHREGFSDLKLQVPCGQCIGCRLERSRQWATRCMHESSLYEDNSFITLTFSETNLAKNKSLNKKDFQKFMKRLRKKFKGQKIRYMHAGEYGEQTQRPHHHAILFGIDFADKKHHSTRNGHKVYTSETLKKVWPYGHSEIGSVTFESTAYVARYCCKKQEEKQTYKTKDKLQKDGRIKEYNTMSRRPGIGAEWLEKYGESDVWNSDTIVIRGKKMKPPKYYTGKYELTNPEEFSILKAQRKQQSADNPNNTWQRLPVREKCQQERFKQLKRSL